MGGGDLNLKKSWHPSTLRNIERVWKAEQKHEAEQKKIEQLQRELAEERAKEEMQHYAEEKGAVQKREEKLDWMYQGPAALVDREQYLTGRHVDKTFEILQQRESGDVPSDNESCIGSLFARSMTNNAPVDIANKIREDPLFLIRKQEEEKQKKLLNNPVKLKQLQEMLRNSLYEDKEKKKHKKKSEKKEKKKSHKKSHKHIKEEKVSPKLKHFIKRERRSSASDSDSDADRRRQSRNRYDSKYDRREKFRGEDWPKREYNEPPRKKKISEEEMEQKRREMMEDAQWRRQLLKKNVHHYKEQQLKEDLEVEKVKEKDFIKPMLSKAAATGTVEARIKQNIYNIQRSKCSMDTNFARR